MLKTLLLSFLVLFVFLSAPVRAVKPSAAADPRALAEATRFLEDELKLASRPQVYLVLDPFERVLLVKSRGLELQRFPVIGWRGADPRALAGVYTLQARPPVSRPKAAPVAEADQLEVIELKDMPETYELVMEPPLRIIVAPPGRDRPWAWVLSHVREWWGRMLDAARIGRPPPRRLRLTVSEETARSVAWSVTERMPLLIGRSVEP